MIDVAGFCPECGYASLYVDMVKAMLFCWNDACPRPDAASLILSSNEIHHRMRITEDGWSMKHPLRERIDDELLDCRMHAEMAGVTGLPRPGEYRLIPNGNGGWSFEPASQKR